MRRLGLIYIAASGFFLSGVSTWAQSQAAALDEMEQDLDLLKQEHLEASSLLYAGLITQLDSAIHSPGAALDLYQKAGGPMPDSMPIVTEHEHETPTEKDERQGEQNVVRAGLAYVAQAHCGLMRYGLAFILKPDQPGLHDEWLAWLKNTAQIYPQLGQSTKQELPESRMRVVGQGSRLMGDLARTSVRDSAIARYLSIYSFGDKEQGNWRVKDVPRLYHDQVLEPLRAAHDPGVLIAWDIFIAMRHADSGDDQKWPLELVSLTFQRDTDDFKMAPDTDKLSTLVALVKAHPDHPQADDMITQVRQMLEDYRALKGGAAAAPPPVPTGPTVTVTTTAAGQGQIITTTTNAAPVAPAAPVRPVSPPQ
jgi:hypothetical protein